MNSSYLNYSFLAFANTVISCYCTHTHTYHNHHQRSNVHPFI